MFILEIFTERNVSVEKTWGSNRKKAQKDAKRLSKNWPIIVKSTSETEWWEKYKNGEKVEWSS